MTVDRQDALRELDRLHSAAIWRYVVHLTGDAASAEDVVQETLLRAWRTPHILDEDPTAVRAWMFTVARHLVVDEARSARRRHETPVDAVPDSTRDDATDGLFDSMLVGDALACLSDEHRAVIIRAYYGGRSTAELGAELQIPEGTVKSRLHYGLRALRLALQERGVTR
ncbi:sigma-70 family RNA polymerase sigma factor [Demequina capsici]|uniref:Sigma-70 family RNA polymerase sigma factor n=1 Tax=Demequina capsici TaxID=3075620 RepID=A0AA96J9U9_9MICO|nr:sigma-70 family RNA polymerase sigma factor [Demequina sp. PMTSA13]WNM26383.1 sigma-70 family RNA polymerase sigma factor [Demequina sp. PMTSA13]